jgi:hypothetical protein
LWKFKKKFTVLLLFNGVFSNAEVIGMKWQECYKLVVAILKEVIATYPKVTSQMVFAWLKEAMDDKWLTRQLETRQRFAVGTSHLQIERQATIHRPAGCSFRSILNWKMPESLICRRKNKNETGNEGHKKEKEKEGRNLYILKLGCLHLVACSVALDGNPWTWKLEMLSVSQLWHAGGLWRLNLGCLHPVADIDVA